jgi:hypothetical protein
MDSAEYDNLGIDLGASARELQGIAHEISDILHLRALIVMGHNHRIQRLFEPINLIPKLDPFQPDFPL